MVDGEQMMEVGAALAFAHVWLLACMSIASGASRLLQPFPYLAGSISYSSAGLAGLGSPKPSPVRWCSYFLASED